YRGEGWQWLAAWAGGPGVPLDAVYSRDPTGTPVRVVTRRGARRIPRDAFGEALLDVPGAPGLFGAAVADGLAHLPYRRLDPRTGSFDSPDPFSGEQGDPRRPPGGPGPPADAFPAAWACT